jgi:hypothetical protein
VPKSTVVVPELVAAHCDVKVVETLKLLGVVAACAVGTVANAAATAAAANTLFKASLPIELIGHAL